MAPSCDPRPRKGALSCFRRRESVCRQGWEVAAPLAGGGTAGLASSVTVDTWPRRRTLGTALLQQAALGRGQGRQAVTHNAAGDPVTGAAGTGREREGVSRLIPQVPTTPNLPPTPVCP